MIVARADDQKAAHRQAVVEIGRVLDGLAISARLCRRASAPVITHEIGVSGSTWEDGTRVAMDHSW